jgi:autotransporter-associated beta strand protein
MPNLAHAQTWLSNVDGSWSDATRWTVLPVSGPGTALTFSPIATQTYTAVDDFAGPFLLNSIVFAGTSSGSVTIGAGSLSSLVFTGASPSIANSSPSQVTILTPIVAPVSGLTINLTSPNASPTTLGGVISGSGAFNISSTGSGSVQLQARNTFSGGVNLTNAQVDLATQTSLGSGTLSVSNGTISTPLFVAPSGYGPTLPIFSNNISIAAGGLNLGGNFGFSLGGNISGSGGITLNPNNLLSGTWTLSGSNSFSGPISVTGPAAGVTNSLVINTPSSLGNPSAINLSGAGANISFVGNTSTFTINAPMNLTNGGAITADSTVTDAKIVYAGAISGNGGLTITAGGSLTLTNANSFTGSLNLVGGTTAVNSSAALGATGSVVFSGGSLVLNPGFGSGAFKINAAVSGSTIYNLDDATLSGAISNASSQGFVKAGAGNLTATASSSFSGSLRIASGTLTVAGAGAVLTSGVASITINAGGGLLLDNTASTNQRIASTGSVVLAGGNLSFVGNATLNASTTLSTTFVVGSSVNQSGAGYDVIGVQSTGAANQAKFQALSRGANGGTEALFTGNNLGQFAISTPTAGATNFSFTTSPASQLVNGIFPWAIADATGANGTDFATYNVTNGIQPLSAYSADFTGGVTANVAVNATTLATGAASLACNSLKLIGGTVNAATGTLTIGAGAILSTGSPSSITGGTIIIGTAATNTTTAPTANFFCVSDLSVTSNLTNFTPGSGEPSGIAKSGAGVLLLLGSNTYTGPTRVLNGTLRLGSSSALTTLSDVFVNPGATLDLNGFNSVVGSINQSAPMLATGNNTYGTIIIGGSSFTAGGDDNSSVYAGDIIGSGTFTKQGLGTLTVLGSQGFTGTVTVAKGSLLLDTHATRGTAFANATKINLGQGSTGTSADVTLGIDFGQEIFSVPLMIQPVTNRTATLKFIQGPRGTPGTTFASPITIAGGTGGTIGLIVDSGGGETLSGPISGTGSLMTVSTASSSAAGSLGFSVNLAGSNSYTGATTLTAPVTCFSTSNAFGAAGSAIGLGSTGGLDDPELSALVGGLTLTRNITVNDSTNSVAAFATISSRAPAGGATDTYSGNINIAGRRSKLILFSLNAPVAFIGTISGVAAANVQIGGTLGTGLEYTNSTVTLSGSNTYAGGTQLYCGTLNVGNSTALSGQTITSGPVGTGTLFIGTSGLPGATEPTLVAFGAARTLANPVVVDNNFSIGAANPLSLSGTIDLAGGARVISVGGVATFSNSIVGAGGSALIKNGPGTLLVAGSIGHTGPTVVNSGTLALLTTQNLSGAMAVEAGAAVTAKAGGAMLLSMPALTVDASNGGRLDLADDDAIVDYTGSSPINSIKNLLTAGCANGAWTGPGITSSVAASVASNAGIPHKTALGYVEASAFNYGTFDGQPVDSSAVLVRYTLAGDANLDGTVNTVDFTLLANNFGASGALWQQGDSNYDGIVNGLDFNAVASNFGSTQAAPALMGSLVPEPGFAGAVAMLVFARRRRRMC